MWKYFVIWGIYIMSFSADTKQIQYMEVEKDSIFFYNKMRAISWKDSASVNYLQPPFKKRGKAFNFRIDSVYLDRRTEKR
jgi:hypothetical protein